MIGISPYLANGWASTVRNTPFVISMTAVQLYVGDPGSSTDNLNTSAVTTRVQANFAAPTTVTEGQRVATTGAPPQWTMTAPETLQYIRVYDALTGGNLLWTARLNQPATVADGDIYTLGDGVSLTITGVAA